jgi:outer membrane protein assembly factor BamB
MNSRVLSTNTKVLSACMVLCTTALMAKAASGPDENWPQWRGPHQDGVAPKANPPVKWSETDNVKWKVKVPGEGSATPIIWGKLVFVQTAVPTGKRAEAKPAEAAEQAPTTPSPSQEGAGGREKGKGKRGLGGGAKPSEYYQFTLLALDRDTGKTVWQQVAKEEVPHEGFKQNDGSFASNSGLTDGERVYAYFGSHGLYCYDFSGKLQWSKELGKMRIVMGFGEGSSPALYNNTLVVNWDNEDGSYIFALDKRSGEILWKEARDERTSWSTPLIVEQDGKGQAVVAATGKIRCYDLASGKVVWECGGLTRNVIPSPIADRELIYCMSGYQGNSVLAIHRGRAGDLTGTAAVAWSYKKNTPYVPSPLLYGEKLYFFASNNGVLSCLEAKTGKVLIDGEKIEALQGVYASPLGADGRVYLVGRNGAAVVLKQSDKVEVLASNNLDDKFDASPVAVDKTLFLRGRANLYAIEAK